MTTTKDGYLTQHQFSIVISMLAVGHISVAYLLTRGLKRVGWPSMSIPLVWAFSLLPDLDLLMPGVRHMGPTHSLLFAIVVLMFLILYRGREATPYFLAYASHTILGDLITNGSVQFLWPLTQRAYQIPLRSLALPFSCSHTFSTNLELALFGLFILVFVITKDYASGSRSNTTKLVSLIPFTALFVPAVFSFPVHVPLLLIPAHLIFMVVVLQPFYPTSLTRVLKR